MDNGIQIVIDDREQKVIPYFNGYSTPPNITYKIERINVGDYSVIYKGYIIFIIERKTWKDLASSMTDGRKNNVNKMIKTRDDTGCQLIYLIEGNPIPKNTAKFCRIPYKSLRAHLDHLAFRDNIHMVYSKNQKNTVDRIFELVKNYINIKPSPLLEIDKLDDKQITDAISKLKEKTQISENSVVYKIWCCVPNITEKTASLFINNGYHIADLVMGRITKDEIHATKYENGYIIGSSRSAKIWNGPRINSGNSKYFVNMLTSINGVTKLTAEKILDEIALDELFDGAISVRKLSEIKKTPKRTIGLKVANDIVKYFVHPPLICSLSEML